MEDFTKLKQHLHECQSSQDMDQQETDEGSSSSSLLQDSESAVVSRHETNDQASNSESKEDVELKKKELEGPHIPQTDSIAPSTDDPYTRYPFLIRIPASNPFGLPEVPLHLRPKDEADILMEQACGYSSQSASVSGASPFLPSSNNFRRDPSLPLGAEEAFEAMPWDLEDLDNTMTRSELGGDLFDRMAKGIKAAEEYRRELDIQEYTKYVVDEDTIKWSENNVESNEDAGLKSEEIGGSHIPHSDSIASWANVPQTAGTPFLIRIPLSNPFGRPALPEGLIRPNYDLVQMQGSSGLVSQTASTTPFDGSKYFKDLPPSNPFGLDPPWDPFLKGELPPGFKEALETMSTGANIPFKKRENSMTRSEIGSDVFDRFVQVIRDTEEHRRQLGIVGEDHAKFVVDGDTIKWG